MINIKSRFGVLIIFLCFSCSQEEQRQAIIKAAIEEKIENYKANTWEAYKKKELETAIQKADSILLLNADLWQIPMDSLRARPPRTTKPGAPNVTVNVDSTPVKPLFPIK